MAFTFVAQFVTVFVMLCGFFAVHVNAYQGLRVLSNVQLNSSAISASVTFEGITNLQCYKRVQSVAYPYKIGSIKCEKNVIKFELTRNEENPQSREIVADEFKAGRFPSLCSYGLCSPTGPSALDFFVDFNLEFRYHGVKYEVDNIRIGQETQVDDENGSSEKLYWIDSRSCARNFQSLSCEVDTDLGVELKIEKMSESSFQTSIVPLGDEGLSSASKVFVSRFELQGTFDLECSIVAKEITSPYEIRNISCSGNTVTFEVTGREASESVADAFNTGVSGSLCSSGVCSPSGPEALNYFAILDLKFISRGSRFEVENFKIGQTGRQDSETGETTYYYWFGSRGCLREADFLYCELKGTRGVEWKVQNINAGSSVLTSVVGVRP
mmetsp:Transcript_5400/g.6521  ORF Transcript_5400/g.6521 Transcript_5400/m.6521 type:complete len:383 (+) Transcript_5400:149-1297(+)|eukprot:CAMPEP_0184009480 /NCGR_PEP_ID=MMETSP0954-20121128/2628_1 /TAXON_ID=627963 /ORGANISM="Aplanochytrium sp, Strain PBS07" /LENGTH=382 /DNA_ID=CAMNT_0026288857 /DNA_START=58 /DNA_END=1206 /DNA_ORIENTATION=-